MSDPLTQRYLDLCTGEGAPLRHAMAEAPLTSDVREAAAGKFLARPIFVAEDERKRLCEDLEAYFDLLVSLPRRLFDGDTLRFCAALGMTERRARILSRYGADPVCRYARADVYRTADGYRLLECNVASNLGGVDAGELERLLLEVPEFAAFAAREGLSYVETSARVAACLSEAGATVGTREPVVAMLTSGQELDRYEGVLALVRGLLERHGLTVALGDILDVRFRHGKPVVRGRPVDVVARYFHVDDLVASHDVEAAYDRLHRARADGKVAIWTALDSSLYSNKGCMALLSDPRWRGAFTSTEAGLLDRLLPWTRFLGGEGGGASPTEEGDIVEYCRAERERVVLKPFTEAGGTGVVAGWETGARMWEQVLTLTRGTGYIAQRRVVPALERVVDPDTGEVRDWTVPLGVFLTPSGYAGTFVRALPEGAGAVVNSGRSREMCIGSFFSYPRVA